MIPPQLRQALSEVPCGRWGIAVSGGADSVGLLRGLVASRADLSLHVIHLDHQARGEQSAADAQFVDRLAASLALPATVCRLDEVSLNGPIAPNRPAHFRQARLALFRDVQHRHALRGVLLAHHADDQAETILQRLLRGAGPTAVGGMRRRAYVGDLLLLRPLLDIRSATLRDYLQSIGQPWREDPSNLSDDYQRNRLRRLLSSDAALCDRLLEVGRASAAFAEWAKQTAPTLPEKFECRALAHLPDTLARQAARNWLVARGAPPDELTRPVLDRLLRQSRDLASPHVAVFPGNVRVRRRAGSMLADAPRSNQPHDRGKA